MSAYVPVTIRATCYEDLPYTLVPSEVALLCSVTPACVLRWLTLGQLRGRKAGGVWLIDKAAILRFANKRHIVLAYRNEEPAI